MDNFITCLYETENVELIYRALEVTNLMLQIGEKQKLALGKDHNPVTQFLNDKCYDDIIDKLQLHKNDEVHKLCQQIINQYFDCREY